jgi:SAM-dependent methyltransferase
VQDYTEEFYRDRHAATRRSAERIVPLVLDLVRPLSVVDVGCGVGTWLSTFQQHGVAEIQGYEGTWLDARQLIVPRAMVTLCDLELPLECARRFDLAVSLEVAEHLPADCAAGFVASLTQLAPVVLFSAAPPGQGGTHHVNEQWPPYWIDLFAARRFEAVDGIRHRIWDDDDILWWYRQNSFLFVSRERLATDERLRAARERPSSFPLRAIHPGLLQSRIAAESRERLEVPSLRESARVFARSLRAAVARRLTRGGTRAK